MPRAFDRVDLARAYETHRLPRSLYAWKNETVAAARAAQVRGRFREPVALRRSLLTERSIYAAAINRLAPQRGLPRTITTEHELSGSKAAWLAEARATFCPTASVALPMGAQSDAFAGVAFHGVHVEQIHWVARSDGSREDAFVTAFPLEAVEFSEIDRLLVAHTTEGHVPIVHGDGRWLVTAQHSDAPWEWGAIVPLSTLWSSIAFARRDRSQNAESHGEDKWLGELPEGVGLDSPQAQALLDELVKLYEFRRCLVHPHGSKIVRNEAMGQNWQIFKEIIEGDTKDAARVMLGQDGTINDAGGNYIKSKTLFGVRNDIVEGDVTARGAAVSTGLLRPWSIINSGTWDAMRFEWVLPDADEDARVESIAKRRESFWVDIERARANGFVVDREYVEKVARAYKVDVPKLADSSPGGGEIFAYDLDGGVVTINEQRARKGLPAVAWGDVTKPEREAQLAALAAAPASNTTTTIAPSRQPLRAAT